MTIGGKMYSEILVTEKDGNNFLVSITDENLISHDSVNVVLVELA